jgi:hypothetical protein
MDRRTAFAMHPCPVNNLNGCRRCVELMKQGNEMNLPNYKFRKKPIVIEAFQMTRDRRASNEEWPEWLHRAWQLKRDAPGHVGCVNYPNSDGTDQLYINTLEGKHLVSWNDYIIRGVAGELYPCKPDIFEATYEPA